MKFLEIEYKYKYNTYFGNSQLYFLIVLDRY